MDNEEIPVITLDDDKTESESEKIIEAVGSPKEFLIPAPPGEGKLFSPGLLESTALDESVNDSYQEVSKNLESTRLSNHTAPPDFDSDLSKVHQEEGDSRNPLNAGFLLSGEDRTASLESQSDSGLSKTSLKEVTAEASKGIMEDSEPESEVSADQSKMVVTLNETGSSDPEVEQIMKLPGTVTELTSKEGVKVYIVGTAHFSVESQEDVAKTIIMTRPRVVMVELCVSRLNILRFDEETILEEAKNINLEKIRSTIKQYGAVQGALYLLFLSTSAHLTRQLGMAPGGEFRRAWQEAREISGCRIHLGDRPIHVTLHRALAALTVWQKAKLVWHLLLNRSPISAADVEKCKQKDLLEEMLEEMTGEFPTLSRVFVQERDLCLAHSLQLAATDAARDAAQLQQGQTPTVVGVVGIGHVPGITRCFGQVTESDVRKVMKIPPPSRSRRVIAITFKLSIAGLVCFGCYKIAPKIAVSLSSIRQAILSR